jgi:hypothetical protein
MVTTGKALFLNRVNMASLLSYSPLFKALQIQISDELCSYVLNPIQKESDERCSWVFSLVVLIWQTVNELQAIRLICEFYKVNRETGISDLMTIPCLTLT